MCCASHNDQRCNICMVSESASSSSRCVFCRLEHIIYKHAESEAGTAEKLVQAKHSPAKSGKK